MNVNAMNLDDLKSLLEKMALEQVHKEFKGLALTISCEGVLSGITKNATDANYRASLRDNHALCITFSHHYIQTLKLHDGLAVLVQGQVMTDVNDGSLTFYLAVSHLALRDSPLIVEPMLTDPILAASAAKHLFPTKALCSLALIYPESVPDSVKQDFLQALLFNQLTTTLTIKHYPVDLHALDDLVNIINNSREDILVLLHASYDLRPWTEITQPDVLTAFAKHRGYRASSIGSSSATLEALADFSVTTPAGLGYHLHEQFITAAQFQHENRRLTKNSKQKRFLLISLGVIILGAVGSALFHQSAPESTKTKLINASQLPAVTMLKKQPLKRDAVTFKKPAHVSVNPDRNDDDDDDEEDNEYLPSF